MNEISPDIFAPIDPAEHASMAATANPAPEWEPIWPVPDDAPAAPVRSSQTHWIYRDAQGSQLFTMCRFDQPNGGKRFTPLTFCQHADGRQEWQWQGLPTPRPLYGLHSLEARPDASVLVVEGEKAADAASALFPDMVTITSPNGAKSATKADWAALVGRMVAIWPDHDNEGRAYAASVVKLATAAGAASVAVVQVPEGFPAKWDLADVLPEGVTDTDLHELVANAQPVQQVTAGTAPKPPKPSMQYGLRMTLDGPNAGLWTVPEDSEKNPMRVSGPFEVVAQTRDKSGNAWGMVLVWHDDDNRRHEWVMPRDLLAGDGAEVRRELLAGGLYIAPSQSARNKLIEYLLNAKTEAKARCVDAVGWHDGAYVTPGKVYGATEGERVLLQTAGRVDDFILKGSFDGWKSEMAPYAVGNSRLALAVAAAFVGSLLRLVNEDSFGLHFVGDSSAGKTTALVAGASVWGAQKYTWRTTDNGGEGLACAANDGFLVLDELSQANGNAADAMTYMLGNGAGKSRMRKDATTKPVATWRLAYLSSGETGLNEKLSEVGKKSKAGQAVRMIEIPADAGAGHKLFETLHGFASGFALSTHLRAAADRHQGHAIREFLDKLTANRLDAADDVVLEVQDWTHHHLPPGADGQVSRVAARFALVAAAGRLAARMGILPWEDGEAGRAAAICFNAWITRRGGVGSAEASAGPAQVRAFIESHGAARFSAIWENGDGAYEADTKTINRAGYRRKNPEGLWEYFVLPEAWKNEVCKGLDPVATAKELAARGLLIRGGDGKATKPVKIPGGGAMRLYHIPPGILAGGGEDA